MDLFVGFVNAALAGLSNLLNGLSYLLFSIVKEVIKYADFDPFKDVIGDYSPTNLIGSEFTDAWAFAIGWIPVRESLALVGIFFGVFGLCVVFRLVYNWVKFGSTKGGE